MLLYNIYMSIDIWWVFSFWLYGICVCWRWELFAIFIVEKKSTKNDVKKKPIQVFYHVFFFVRSRWYIISSKLYFSCPVFFFFCCRWIYGFLFLENILFLSHRKFRRQTKTCCLLDAVVFFSTQHWQKNILYSHNNKKK